MMEILTKLFEELQAKQQEAENLRIEEQTLQDRGVELKIYKNFFNKSLSKVYQEYTR